MGQGRSCPSSDTLKCPKSAVIFKGQKTGLELRLKVSCHTLQSSSKRLFRATGGGSTREREYRGEGVPPTMSSHIHLVPNWKYYSPAGPSPFSPTLISNNTWLFPEFKSTPKGYEFASGERLLRAYKGFKGDPQRGMARNDPATAAASATRIACASIDGFSV